MSENDLKNRRRIEFLLDRCQCSWQDKDGHDHSIWNYGSLDEAMKMAEQEEVEE